MLEKLKQLKKLILGDADESGNLNAFMRKKQHLVGIGVLVVFVIITCVLHSLAQKKKPPQTIELPAQSIAVDGVLSSDFTQKNELSALEQQQLQMDHLKKELSTLQEKMSAEKDAEKSHKAEIINEINTILAKRESEQKQKQVSTPLSEIPFSTDDTVDNKVTGSIAPKLETIQFHYKKPTPVNFSVPQKITSRIKTPKNYVPAGTFAQVILLEGADANASVNGQSNTVGILVRILDEGTLPNGHHSHLKGCFVLASIYGDISSERGEARLTKISCTRPDGRILEKKVQGYLSFLGKEGIKGTPVMRNWKVLSMAGFSGLLSGVGSGLQQSTQIQSSSPLGSITNIDPNKVWQNGLYGGANTAMSRLANYYIKRADQYHPIIEIGSGTVATVVFQNGFSLVDDEEEATDHHSQPTASITSSNNSTEMKDLLKEAHAISEIKETEPFSNTN